MSPLGWAMQNAGPLVRKPQNSATSRGANRSPRFARFGLRLVSSACALLGDRSTAYVLEIAHQECVKALHIGA